MSLRKGCVGVGGCPWRVLSAKGPSWGFWVGTVKNDRNFSSGNAYGVVAPIPPSGSSWQKNRPASPVLVHSCPLRCPFLSISWAIPVVTRVLRLCVPAEMTGTRAMDRVLVVRVYCFCTCGAHNAIVVCAYSSCLSLLSVHPWPLLSFVTDPFQPARPCAHN